MIPAIRVTFTLLLLLAGWRVFHQLVAFEVARRNPTVEMLQEAIEWDPQGPDAYYQIGLLYRDDLGYQDLELARENLEEATQLNPYHWAYWLELARTYEISDMPVPAEEAYLKAVEINPREGAYRWWFANYYLREQKLEEALGQFERTIELEPGQYLRTTLALLWKAGVTSHEILSIWPEDKHAHLMLMQFWVNQDGVEQKLLHEQWEGLVGGESAPTVREGDFYVRHLIEQERFSDAKEAWTWLAARNAMEDGDYEERENLVWNGDFHLPISGRVLDWVAQINSDTVQISTDGEVRIDFKGTENINFDGLRQRVIVDAGEQYRFSFRARSEEISTEQGLYFDVVAGSVLVETEPILGTTPWTEYRGSFTVPRDRNLVTVRLRRRPSKRIDNKLRGTLWVSSVEITEHE